MWDFVAEHWEELRAGGDDMALAYLLVRRLGRSLSGPGIERGAAELGDAGPLPPPNKIHPAEMYIVPPLPGTEPGVADLFCERSEENGDRWWLVVTPRHRRCRHQGRWGRWSPDSARSEQRPGKRSRCNPDHGPRRSAQARPMSRSVRPPLRKPRVLRTSHDPQPMPQREFASTQMDDVQWQGASGRHRETVLPALFTAGGKEQPVALGWPAGERVIRRPTRLRGFGRVCAGLGRLAWSVDVRAGCGGQDLIEFDSELLRRGAP